MFYSVCCSVVTTVSPENKYRGCRFPNFLGRGVVFRILVYFPLFIS